MLPLWLVKVPIVLLLYLYVVCFLDWDIYFAVTLQSGEGSTLDSPLGTIYLQVV